MKNCINIKAKIIKNTLELLIFRQIKEIYIFSSTENFFFIKINYLYLTYIFIMQHLTNNVHNNFTTLISSAVILKTYICIHVTSRRKKSRRTNAIKIAPKISCHVPRKISRCHVRDAYLPEGITTFDGAMYNIRLQQLRARFAQT